MKKLYAIRDLAADDYIGGVQLHHSDAVAVRSFGDILRSRDTLPGQHPHDFSLYVLGELSERGIEAWKPELVITGSQWVQSQQNTGVEAEA